jgi:ribokinase
LNADLVVRTPRFPQAGETVLGGPLERFAGGKGLNQAVAAARMGAHVAMVGAVGADEHAAMLLEALRVAGIDVGCVRTLDGVATGAAVIVVDASGENQIVVAPGANALILPEHVDAAADVIEACDVLVVQLEIPLASIARAFEIARRAGRTILMNAAPAQALSAELLAQVDVLVVNQSEAELLAGTNAPAREVCAQLARAGPRALVLTLGARGAVWLDADRAIEQPAPSVEVLDTTACGDAFVGALVADGDPRGDPERALELACAAGALAATRAGAVPSLPSRVEVERLIAGGSSSP